MDELVAIIMAVFIANYQTHEHPYLTACIKAFLVALLGFIWGIGADILNHEFTFERLVFTLKLAILLWIALSFLFCLAEIVFSKRDE
jgi:hypothetical protein